MKRLLKVSNDYEQIRASSLEVEYDRITLTLELHPWHIVQALRRVEESRQTGFYKASDLYHLDKHGMLNFPVDAKNEFTKRSLIKRTEPEY